MQQTIAGQVIRAGGSASFPAELSRRNDAIYLRPEGDGEPEEVSVTRIADRLAGVRRKVYLADGSVFETPDNDSVDDFFGLHRSFAVRVAAFERSWRWIASAIVISIVVVFAGYRYGIPVAAKFASGVTPGFVMSSMDYGTLQTLDKAIFSASKLDETTRERYRAVFSDLVSYAERQEPAPQLLFRDGGRIGANALALPGGSVVLTDQLVMMASEEDEIAGVLAHEIGHVAGRHSLQQIYRALGFYMIVTAVTGDTSQLLDEVAAQAGTLQQLAYQREFEQDADHRGAAIMLKAGRDPAAILRLFARIAEKCGESCKETGLLSTHPGMDDRRADILKTIEALRSQR